MVGSKKPPAWKAYTGPVAHHLPRLAEKDADGIAREIGDVQAQELEHRAKLLYLRDYAHNQREKSAWFDDQVLRLISDIITPYALSSRLRADQIATLWSAMSDLAGVVSKLRAIGLE